MPTPRPTSRSLRSFLFVISLLAAFAWARPARAQDPSGVWKSDTGNTFIIPPAVTGDFDMIKVVPAGTKELLRAAWVTGMEGTQFAYMTGGVRYVCTFNGQNPDRIQVAYGEKANFWTRVRHAQFGWRGVLGTWRSTSGNTFLIVDRGKSFNIIFTDTKGAKSVITASWIPGMEGTQFEYTGSGSRVVATRVPRDENQIRVETNTGQVTFWTRVAR